MTIKEEIEALKNEITELKNNIEKLENSQHENWEITNNRMIIYNKNKDIIKIYNLYDNKGNPTENNPKRGII